MADHEIFYDAECGFCRRTLRILLEWDRQGDRRLRPIALQTEEAARQLAPIPRAEQFESMRLRLPGGEVLTGGDALPALLGLTHRHAIAARAMRRLPGLTRRGYRFIADHRVGFGRLTRRMPDYRVND